MQQMSGRASAWPSTNLDDRGHHKVKKISELTHDRALFSCGLQTLRGDVGATALSGQMILQFFNLLTVLL